MASDGHVGAITHWIRYGPRDVDGTVGWFLGMWLWWRTWALGVLALAPLVAGALAYTHVSAGTGVLVAALTGLAAGGKILEVSPKYDVTKNY